MANINKFRIMKTAGSPSVEGASGMETLAGHTSNPEAHPDYMKKDAYPSVFGGAEHLTDKLSHAPYFIRRAEVAVNKMDYERTKNLNLANNAGNYMAASSVSRYLITSYVLNQILQDLGLSSGNTYIKTSQIVGTTSRPPSSNPDLYVPSYALYNTVKQFVDRWSGVEGIEATYLKKADAQTIYVPADVYNAHSHDAMNLNGMPGLMAFSLTNDKKYQEDKDYYVYNTSTKAMELVSPDTYTIGANIPVTTNLYENRGAEIDALMEATFPRSGAKTASPVMMSRGAGEDDTINELKECVGFAYTTDTEYVAGQTYYSLQRDVDTGTTKMVVDDNKSSTPVERNLFIKVATCLTFDRAKLGYALSADTAPVEGTTYYKYDAEKRTMTIVTNTYGYNPVKEGWYVKVRSPERYDDTEIKAKLGFVRTEDVGPVLGTVYYRYDTKEKMMVRLNTAESIVGVPENPSANCWVKGKSAVAEYQPTVDVSDLRTTAGYVFCWDAERIGSKNYYTYNAKVNAMQIVPAEVTKRPVDGWYIKLDSSAEIKPRDIALNMAPDVDSIVDCTANLQRVSGTNFWELTVPQVAGKDVSGEIHLSATISAGQKTYGVVKLSKGADYSAANVAIVPVVNTTSTTFDSTQLPQPVVVFTYSGSVKSGQVIRIGLLSTTGDSLPYTEGYAPRKEVPTLVTFMPFLARNFV